MNATATTIPECYTRVTALRFQCEGNRDIGGWYKRALAAVALLREDAAAALQSHREGRMDDEGLADICGACERAIRAFVYLDGAE